jgi:hypothetical protein
MITLGAGVMKLKPQIRATYSLISRITAADTDTIPVASGRALDFSE